MNLQKDFSVYIDDIVVLRFFFFYFIFFYFFYTLFFTCQHLERRCKISGTHAGYTCLPFSLVPSRRVTLQDFPLSLASSFAEQEGQSGVQMHKGEGERRIGNHDEITGGKGRVGRKYVYR